MGTDGVHYRESTSIELLLQLTPWNFHLHPYFHTPCTVVALRACMHAKKGGAFLTQGVC